MHKRNMCEGKESKKISYKGDFGNIRGGRLSSSNSSIQRNYRGLGVKLNWSADRLTHKLYNTHVEIGKVYNFKVYDEE